MEDKIRDIMIKCGLRAEAADQVCETIEQYVAERKTKLDGEYAARLEEAKQVCVEETENHKRELAWRLQVFCEAKVAAVEAVIAKQTAIKESASIAKLQDIMSLLEGVEPNGAPNSAIQMQVQKLRRQLSKLAEERNRAVETANRANAIAETVLKRNRKMETESVAKRNGATTRKPAPSTDTQAAQRLDESRRPATPTTTRKTLVENQDRRPSPGNQTVNEYSPEGIAAIMDGDLI